MPSRAASLHEGLRAAERAVRHHKMAIRKHREAAQQAAARRNAIRAELAALGAGRVKA